MFLVIAGLVRLELGLAALECFTDWAACQSSFGRIKPTSELIAPVGQDVVHDVTDEVSSSL